MILEKNLDAFRYVSKYVNQWVKAEDLHLNNYVMACDIAIPFAENTLKKSNLGSDFYN